MPISTSHSSLYVTQLAIATALSGASAFTSICAGPFDFALPNPAWQINQVMPYATFGDHVESNWSQFQRPSKQIDFSIHIFSQQTTYQEAFTIIDVICSVIENQTLSLTGGNFTNAQNGVMFLTATKVPEGDGTTRHIEGRWHIWNNAN
jgi:hypothetical protein